MLGGVINRLRDDGKRGGPAALIRLEVGDSLMGKPMPVIAHIASAEQRRREVVSKHRATELGARLLEHDRPTGNYQPAETYQSLLLRRITTDACLEVGITVELANWMKGFSMGRRKSFTSQLYSLARLSNNLSAASKGPGSYAKRMARRKVYRKQMSLTRAILKGLGLSK